MAEPLKLQLSKRIFNDAFYPMLFDYSHRYEVYKGSAGSGKSHFISQKLIIKAINDDNRRILVCRRWGSTVRETVWQLIVEQLRFFTDVADKAAFIIGNKKFRFSACGRKRKLNLGKEIAESLTRLCRDHDELALCRKNE